MSRLFAEFSDNLRKHNWSETQELREEGEKKSKMQSFTVVATGKKIQMTLTESPWNST